jgi:hypothetical protein
MISFLQPMSSNISILVKQHLEYNHKLIQFVNILNKNKPMINYMKTFDLYMSFKNLDSTPRSIGLMGLIGRLHDALPTP